MCFFLTMGSTETCLLILRHLDDLPVVFFLRLYLGPSPSALGWNPLYFCQLFSSDYDKFSQ